MFLVHHNANNLACVEKQSISNMTHVMQFWVLEAYELKMWFDWNCTCSQVIAFLAHPFSSLLSEFDNESEDVLYMMKNSDSC